ncbi:MAG TPA: hypothetical protein RMG48_18075 [Myxococcales bacterium LLY-WYZ-16_1]|nr:hypothetical protein [Myxococcales bacterium LLY-WYZ-16_1]
MNLALAFLLWGAGPDGPIDPTSLDDLARIPAMLRARVAVVELQLQEVRDLPLLPERRTFYGVPIGPHRVACVAQFLEHGKAAVLKGPEGRAPAFIEVDDRERRVAVLRSERPVADLGLMVPAPLPKDERVEDASVFALLDPGPDGTAVSGVIQDPGVRPELDHLPVSTLQLKLGMPVFDEHFRWVGLARTVGWDVQPGLLIPPELVEQARTEAARTQNPPAPEAQRPPWWTRSLRRRPARPHDRAVNPKDRKKRTRTGTQPATTRKESEIRK